MGVPAISSGELLRRAIAERSPLGLRVERVLTGGALVDDGIMSSLVRWRVAEPDAAGGFVLDGYPRTLDQAEFLDDLLARPGLEVDAALLIDVPEDVARQRLLARRRGDDRHDAIAERLRSFRRDTRPVIDRYRRAGLLTHVNGTGPMDEVTALILGNLGTV
jgi:adenylate kinase